MTKNQIEYQKLLVSRGELEERKRANRAQEVLGQGNLDELKRSNVAREVETNRSNVAKETENNRHNLATELESNRHNVQAEKSDLMKAQAALSQAAAAHAQVAENERHNKAWEIELNRANEAAEAENYRSNLMKEFLQEYANKSDRMRAEAALNTSTVKAGELKELIRKDLMNEGFTREQIEMAWNRLPFENLRDFGTGTRGVSDAIKNIIAAGGTVASFSNVGSMVPLS